jgi:hypothetical protein
VTTESPDRANADQRISGDATFGYPVATQHASALRTMCYFNGRPRNKIRSYEIKFALLRCIACACFLISARGFFELAFAIECLRNLREKYLLAYCPAVLIIGKPHSLTALQGGEIDLNPLNRRRLEPDTPLLGLRIMLRI